MSALSVQPTFPIFTDIDGQPLENGYIWIGIANLDPQTNPVQVYWDAALTLPAAQPIRTLAGYPANSGTPARLYVNSDYSIRVMNKNGSTVYSAPEATERYSGVVISTIDASNVLFTQTGSGAVPTTAQDEFETIRITPQQFDAAGDGVNDDTTALNDAIAAVLASTEPAVLVGYGTYKITSTVNFRQIRVDFDRASIDVAHAGIGITIGGNASSANNPTQRFNSVTRSVGSDSTTTPTVRALGVKGQFIYLNFTTYFQVYADTHSVGDTALRDLDYSCAYSSFWLKRATTIELTNNPANAGGPNNSNPGGSIQWINENIFYLNRTGTLLINGTYFHNHNKFYDGTFEGAATINWDVARDTYLYGARFEGGPTNITFGNISQRNVIEKTWSSSETLGSIFAPIVNGTIVDNGVQNQVYDYRGHQYSRSVVARADVSDVIVNNKIGFAANRNSDLQRIYAVSNSSSIMVETDFLPVVDGDEYTWNAYGQDSGDPTLRYRPSIEFYDKNLQPVADATGYVVSSTLTSVSGNTVTVGTGSSGGRARITSTAVAGAAFVKAMYRTSFNQQSGWVARFLEIYRYSKELTSNDVKGMFQAQAQVVSAAPTQGFAPVGFTCIKSDGASLYINTFALDTVSTSAQLSGATSVDATSVTGINNGDIIGINQDDRSTHWTTVASVVGNVINLTAPLTFASNTGSRIVINRWATK